jgi:succinate dehydrogenase / fumarate reductase, flavoprotein subunit
MIAQLQTAMADDVGPFRTDAKLRSAVTKIDCLREELSDAPACSGGAFDSVLSDWLDLRNMLQVAQSVVLPALARTESRGAHQRDDYLGMNEEWCVNQVVSLSGDKLVLHKIEPSTGQVA